MEHKIEWRFVKLCEIARLVTGKTPSKQMMEYYTTEGGVPWVKIENLGHREIYKTGEYLTKQGAGKGITVPENAVLLATNRTIGKVGIAGRALQTNQQITAIICNEDSGILPEYLYYYLKFSEHSIQNMAYATVANRISKEVLGQFIIPVAPGSNQIEWIRILKCVEDYLWKKEEMLQVIAEFEEQQMSAPSILQDIKNNYIRKLRTVTENMIETIQELLDSLLYNIFGKIEKEKNRYYEGNEKKLVLSEEYDRLAPEAGKLLQSLSYFQQELYRKFYEAGKELAVHEVLKQMKKESTRFKNQNIQNALTAIEAFDQIGLLKKENKKLLYHHEKDPTEENIVRDPNGNDLGIGMWSCIFPNEE